MKRGIILGLGFVAALSSVLWVAASAFVAAQERQVTYALISDALAPAPAAETRVEWRTAEPGPVRPFTEADAQLIGRALTAAWQGITVAQQSGEDGILDAGFSGPALERARISVADASAHSGRMAVLRQTARPIFFHADGSVFQAELDLVLAYNIIAGIDLDGTQLKGKPLRQALVRVGGAAVARALTAADCLTVPVRSYAESLSATYPRAAVHHLPHGTFDTEPRETAPLAARPKRIVTMGKFGTYKRLETLLAAFDLLRETADFADYELVIGGADHPGTPGYVDKVAAARADDRGVRFHGYVAEDDIAAFFSAARLSVFDYSATTGSSGVLHQTASYGAVPVFPFIGDFVDVSRDEGLAGFNYAANDAAVMAAAMATALSDLDVSQALGDANRRATVELPLADVAAFHVERLRSGGTGYGDLVEA